MKISTLIRLKITPSITGKTIDLISSKIFLRREPAWKMEK